MKKVTVLVDEETNVVSSVLLNEVPVPEFEIVRKKQEASLPLTVVREFWQRAGRDPLLDKALRACCAPRVLAVVPWRNAHVPPGCSYADGVAYALPAGQMPSGASFFPVNWRYAAGIALVEIEPVLDTNSNSALSADFFMTRQFQEKHAAFARSARGPNNHEDIPGFVLPETIKHLEPFAQSGASHDPLLAKFKPDFVKSSKLRLQDDDYIAFCTSNWNLVSKDTKACAGHVEGARHYYAVVKYALPVECVDQLKMVVYTNPNKVRLPLRHRPRCSDPSMPQDTWGKLASRKLFERAQETARGLRARFLVQVLEAAGLQAKRSNPRVVDSTTDVFAPATLAVTSSGEAEAQGIVFYAGCTPTCQAVRGVVAEVGPDRDAGLLWLHGSPSEKVGGDAWPQPASVHSLPVYSTARSTAKTLDTYVAAGWCKEWGYAKLEPIVFT